MEYTDTELLQWWGKLSKQDQRDIMDGMLIRMDNLVLAQSLYKQWESDLTFSPKQLAVIRKWDT